MSACVCGHDRRSHFGGRCWVSTGCARDTDPHAVCSPECKASRVCPCAGYTDATPDREATRGG